MCLSAWVLHTALILRALEDTCRCCTCKPPLSAPCVLDVITSVLGAPQSVLGLAQCLLSTVRLCSFLGAQAERDQLNRTQQELQLEINTAVGNIERLTSDRATLQQSLERAQVEVKALGELNQRCVCVGVLCVWACVVCACVGVLEAVLDLVFVSTWLWRVATALPHSLPLAWSAGTLTPVHAFCLFFVVVAVCASLLVEVEKFKTMASTSVTAKEDMDAKLEVVTSARAVAEEKVKQMAERLTAMEEAHGHLGKQFQVRSLCLAPVPPWPLGSVKPPCPQLPVPTFK